MKNLTLPISIVAASLIVAGAIIYTKNTQKTGESETGEQKEAPKTEITVSENDHIRGNLQAPVTIVEFSDFQCQFCAAFHPTVQKILADFGDNARWVYKHFPLDKVHPQARPAAEASECVFEQKRGEGFWQFADSLFENQERLGEAFYKELAGQIGLNLEQFNNCVSSRKYKDKVEANLQEGKKAGVDRTPWSFVNGEPILGAVPYETLKEAIEKALARVAEQTTSGSEIVSRDGIHWHPELSIKILGQEIEIPANIGLGITEMPLHTHDNMGVIHLEFPGMVKEDDIRLGKFFEIWGKTFNKDCIFDKCSGPEGQLKMLVNGELNYEFENYTMKDGDKMEIIYE